MNNLVQTILGPAENAVADSRQLYRVHRKNGQPFALLPSHPALQGRLAHLLPAQSWKARLYRQMVRLAGLAGLCFPRESDQVGFPRDSAIVSLLRKISQSPAAPILLPGNPHGIAPRLVFICLDDNARPVGVIKAGHTPAARELIRREHAVLQQLQNHPVAMPAPRPFDLVETDRVSAFGMEFVPGTTPAWSADHARLAGFLTPWIDETRSLRIADLRPWQALTAALRSADEPLAKDLIAFAETEVHPTWFHGDLAPWNLRVQAKDTWTAIDWERGEPEGIPGWDWLHFSLQPAILVKKWSANRVLAHAQSTLQSSAFRRYLAKAFPNAHPTNTPELLLRSYLLYNWHVLTPSEARAVQGELLIDNS